MDKQRTYTNAWWYDNTADTFYRKIDPMFAIAGRRKFNAAYYLGDDPDASSAADAIAARYEQHVEGRLQLPDYPAGRINYQGRTVINVPPVADFP